MNFVFFDTETTSTDHIFGQMVEFSAIYCNDKFEPLSGPVSLSCRLMPGVIPEPEALLVTRKTIEEINSRPQTHYEMVSEITRLVREWSPSIWIGWNSIDFDFKWLRAGLYKSLHDVNLYESLGNKRADALAIARAMHLFCEDGIKIPKNARGKKTFKLEGLSKENNVAQDQAHSAWSDTLATLELSKLLKEKNPQFWDSSLQSSSKFEADDKITKELFFLLADSFFGNSRGYALSFLCYHPLYNWPMCLDLGIDPETYIRLDGVGLRAALRSSPKILRTVRSADHPILLDNSFLPKIAQYKGLDLETLGARAAKVKGDREFISRVRAMLVDEDASLERETREPELEERYLRRHNPPPLVPMDQLLLKHFHSLEDPMEKYEVSLGFEDARLQRLAKLVVYEKDPTILAPSCLERVKTHIAKRVGGGKDALWNTREKAEAKIGILRKKSKDAEEVKILDSVENYLKTI